jgi:hypothetical protein
MMTTAMTSSPLARSLALAAIVLLTLGSATACTKGIRGSGKVVEDVRQLSGFTSIRVKSSADVEIRQSTRDSVTVVTDDNIAPIIETRVIGQSLEVDTHKSYSTRRGVRVIVEVKSLNAVYSDASGDVKLQGPFNVDALTITLSGSGDLQASDTVTANNLKVRLRGSGDVAFDQVNAKVLDLDISGSGDFIARGKVNKQTIAIGGSGDVNAGGLEGESVSVTVSGSGDVRVWATTALNAEVRGSGDIVYRGNPATLSKSVSGSGDITSL